jgi:hypothetical protein
MVIAGYLHAVSAAALPFSSTCQNRIYYGTRKKVMKNLKVHAFASPEEKRAEAPEVFS